MGVSQSKNQNKKQGNKKQGSKKQGSNSNKINNDEKNIPKIRANSKSSNVKDNKFNRPSQKREHKNKGDPGYSWHHDTQEGRKVLSSLTDAFYMD